MTVSTHRFSLTLRWDGDTLSGLDFRDKTRRRHTVHHDGKPDIEGSAAPAFHGEKSRWNPEDLFLASLAQCHMLTFFYLANEAGVEVADYADAPEATLQTHPDGSGEIVDVVLRPVVTIRSGDAAIVETLHHRAHSMCFIARSVSVPVRHEATTIAIT